MQHNFIPAILVMAGGVGCYNSMLSFFHTCDVHSGRRSDVSTLLDAQQLLPKGHHKPENLQQLKLPCLLWVRLT